MNIKRFLWLFLIFICLSFVSFSLPDVGSAIQADLNAPLAPQATIPLTNLEGYESNADLAYDPQLDQFLLVYVNVTPADYLFSIQAQFLSSIGEPTGQPLILSSQDAIWRKNPSVAYNSHWGEFLVIWDEQFGDVNYDIYAQRLSINGSKLGGIITIDHTSSQDERPDLVFNSLIAEYLAVWERYNVDQSEIYAQRLDIAGNPLPDGGFYIASDSISEEDPAVAYEADIGYYMVVYHARSENFYSDIYGQRVSAWGELVGGLITISTAQGSQLNPQLAYNSAADQFLVVWQDARLDSDIYGQVLDADGALVGENFAIADQGENYRNDPQVTYQPNNMEYMVVWSMNLPSKDVNVYRRMVTGNGVASGEEILVSGESTSEQGPTIIAGGGSKYQLAWQDGRDVSLQDNIYGELFSTGPVETCGGVFTPTADATVYQNDPTTPYSGSPYLEVNRGADLITGNAHTYFAFDLGDRIPEEAIIHSAELELTLVFPPPDPAEFQLQVMGSPQSWDEATLTWDTVPSSRPPFQPMSYAPVWSDRQVVLHIDVSTLVNLWSTDVYTPTGLVLLPGGEVGMHLGFYSRNSQLYAPRLVIHCSASVPPPSRSYEDLNARQLAGIERLSAASSLPLTIQLGESGEVSFAMFDIPTPPDMTDPIIKAIWFTQAFSDVLRLTDPMQDLQFVRSSDDNANQFFRQRIAGIPVLGSEIGIYLTGGNITGLSGSYWSNLPEPIPLPLINPERAREIALAIADREASVISDDALRLLNPSLFGPDETRAYLTWLVVLDVDGGTEYYIDANTGALRFTQPRSLAGFDLDIETGNGYPPTDNYCGTWWWTTYDDHWCDEDGCNSDADAEGISTKTNANKVYYFWKNYLNRDSYDNDGSEIQIYIHVGINWSNSQWVCDRFEFGDGWPVLDMLGHEFAHAVTDSTSELIYANQSGALNESFSDIFGAFGDTGDWLIGEDLPNGALRSMADPTLYGDPDRFSNYWNTTSDYGGVHTNSGINNKAAYLITTGDDFNGVNLPWGGIGLYRARILFYKALMRLPSNASMLDARNCAVGAALELAREGKYSFTSSQVCIVRNAYHAVELGDSDLDCDGVEDTPDIDDDGDNIRDSTDNCNIIPNPDQLDTDNDGQGDVCDTDDDNDSIIDTSDNCSLAYNPSQLNTDGDVWGDACDDNDDNDMIPDTLDNCPTVSNWDQLDTDGDGRGDACDSDDDNDWITDANDNCSLVPNKDQANSDNDPFGDACDLCPKSYGTDNGDPDQDGRGNSCDYDDDNDGLLDAVDNCPQAYNPDQSDLDGDGKGWACDYDDADELLAKLKTMRLKYWEGYPFRFPLPGCGVCKPGYIDPMYFQKINLVSNAGFHAQIVDSLGNVVARTSPGAPDLLNQSLILNPAPFSVHIMQVEEGNSEIQGIFLPPDSMRYYLELFPAEGLDLSQEYDMSILVEEDFYEFTQYTYLPVTVQPP